MAGHTYLRAPLVISAPVNRSQIVLTNRPGINLQLSCALFSSLHSHYPSGVWASQQWAGAQLDLVKLFEPSTTSLKMPQAGARA